jgi:hypothetical protein
MKQGYEVGLISPACMTELHFAPPRWRRRLLFPLLLLAHGGLFLLSGPGSAWRAQASKPARVAVPMLWLKPRKVPAPMSRPLRVPPAARAQMTLKPQPSVDAALAAVPMSAAQMAPVAPAATSAESGSTDSAASTASTTGTASASGRAPLVISLPRSGRPGEFSPSYNPAAHDPRSNSIRLTFSEKMALATGNAQCFLEERNPDGSIYRGPGRLVSRASAAALNGAAAESGGRIEVCVR